VLTTTESALEAAILLGTQGYACFPCNNEKKPTCPHGFKEASTDLADLIKLWDRHPGGLVGVATGPASQIAVVDVDGVKHPEATVWWLDNKGRLLPTRVHRTRSGGLHLLYGDYDGLKCSTSRINKGVDVRAGGGYIIWWPAAGCQVLSDAPCAPWPDFLEYLTQPPAPPPATISERAVAARYRRAGPRVVEARIYGLLKYVHGATEGERNARVFWAACKLRDMIAAREISDDVGNHAFEELRQVGIHIGLSNYEIIHTIRSAAFGNAGGRAA
jgi:hypothetical protein